MDLCRQTFDGEQDRVTAGPPLGLPGPLYLLPRPLPQGVLSHKACSPTRRAKYFQNQAHDRTYLHTRAHACTCYAWIQRAFLLTHYKGQIEELFRLLDEDDDGWLRRVEMRDGLERLAVPVGSVCVCVPVHTRARLRRKGSGAARRDQAWAATRRACARHTSSMHPIQTRTRAHRAQVYLTLDDIDVLTEGLCDRRGRLHLPQV